MQNKEAYIFISGMLQKSFRCHKKNKYLDYDQTTALLGGAVGSSCCYKARVKLNLACALIG